MASPQHIFDMGDFGYARTEVLSPLVRRVLCENPNHFTYTGTATFIVGHGDVAIIDPGPAYPPHLEAIRAAVAGERVTHVLVTHTHSDHSTAAPALAAEFGVRTYGYGPHGQTHSDEPFGRIDFSAHFTEEELAAATAEWESMPDELKHESADLDFHPDVAMSDGDRVAGSRWTMEAVWTPGHCSNHLCFSLNEEQTLFSGDHIMGWATSVIGPPDGSMAEYLASLNKVLHRDDRLLRPTHGPAIENPGTYISSLLSHRRDREAQIIDAIGRGLHTIAEIVPDLYAKYDKRLWYPAAASVHSHLLGLAKTGRVTADPQPSIDATYRLT